SGGGRSGAREIRDRSRHAGTRRQVRIRTRRRASRPSRIGVGAMRAKILCVLWVACGCFASPARAQMNVRVFGDAAEESFAAVQTFEAVFGQSMQPLFGGGVEVTLLSDRVFVDLGASQFKKTGDRVFRNGAQVFHLGIPMHVTLTPLELTGGYRFHVRRHSWLVPYGGAGVGWYRYRETSDFATDDENVDTRHAGFVV